MGTRGSSFQGSERRELVSELSGAGMSTRAIAPIVGTGQTQVRRDLGQVSPDGSPETATSEDVEWRDEPIPVPRPDPEGDPVEVYQPFNRDDRPSEPVKTMGMDGKEYTRAVPTFCPHLPRFRVIQRLPR